ncbi:hypothetical protein V8C35DRAFT_50056 [Trichoderma chlorosporum]
MAAASASASANAQAVGVSLTRGAGLTPPPNCTPSASFFVQDCIPPSRIPPWSPANPLSLSSKRRLFILSLQQEPDSAHFLQGPRSAQSPTETACNGQSMDFLASFNFRDEEPSRLESQPFASAEELQSQLRDVFSGKVSETRAERVATRLDLAASAELTLGVSEGDNQQHVLDRLSTRDPSLGGARSAGVSVDADGGQAGRVVRVSDALLNQPADDPVLQKSIANYLVARIGQVDGSEWVVREISRAAQNWVFSYVCRGSMQHWKRQHKSQAKPLVADYSQREIDPLLASRPAFDCRGSLIVSFSRNSRTITIDYDHIPLHRTVAQLAILLKPSPPRHPLPATDSQQPKTPKKPSSSRKKRDTDKAPGDEGSRPKKRKKKAGDAAASGEQGEDGAQDAAIAQVSQLQLGEESSSSTGQQQNAQDSTAAAQNSTAGLLTINVSPEEAERRRNVAMVMLQNAGVDPDSLSPEQFNIFSNQSPELQKESLNMLVKYGAERLRIVHPGNKEGSAPPSASNPSAISGVQSNVQGSPSGLVTTNELVLQTNIPTTKKTSRKKNQTANNDGEDGNAAGSAKKSRRKGTGKSKNACAQCKQRRVKCPRETPTCSGCREAGLICEYAAPKPKKMKSNAIITVEDEQDELDEQEEQDEIEQDNSEAELPDEMPLEDQQLHEDAEGYPELHEDSVHHQMPIGDMLANNMDDTAADWEQNHASHNFFQHANMGVSEEGSSQPSQQSSVPLSGLILPQGRQYYPNISAPEVPEQALAQPMAHEHRNNPAKSSAKGSGRNKSKRAAQQQDSLGSLNHTAASDWHNGANPVTQAAAVVAAVVTSMQDQNPQDSPYGIADTSSRSSAWRPTAIPQALENPQQQHVAAASLQRSGTVSPMHDISRAASSSWTGKNQKRGAVHETSTAGALQSPNRPEQRQQQQQQSHSHGQGLQAPAGMSGSAAYNSYDRYSRTRGAGSDVSPTDRITYEPYSYQRDATGTASYTNYGHGSQAVAATTTTTAATMQAAAAMPADRLGKQAYGSYGHSASHSTSHTNQPSSMGSRGNAQTQDYSNNNSDLPHSTRQAFNMRSQNSTPRPGQNAMKQDRNYSTYPSQIQQQQQQRQQNAHQRAPQQQQQQQHTQQPGQHQSWYGFNNQSGAGYAAPAAHGSNYSWNMQGDS